MTHVTSVKYTWTSTVDFTWSDLMVDVSSVNLQMTFGVTLSLTPVSEVKVLYCICLSYSSLRRRASFLSNILWHFFMRDVWTHLFCTRLHRERLESPARKAGLWRLFCTQFWILKRRRAHAIYWSDWAEHQDKSGRCDKCLCHFK